MNTIILLRNLQTGQGVVGATHFCFILYQSGHLKAKDIWRYLKAKGWNQLRFVHSLANAWAAKTQIQVAGTLGILGRLFVSIPLSDLPSVVASASE